MNNRDDQIIKFMEEKGEATVKEMLAHMGLQKGSQLSQVLTRQCRAGRLTFVGTHNCAAYRFNATQKTAVPTRGKSFEDVATEYCYDWFAGSKYLEKTFQIKMGELGLISKIIGNPPITGLDDSRIAALSRYHDDKNLTPATKKTRLNLLAAVIAFAADKGYIDNPKTLLNLIRKTLGQGRKARRRRGALSEQIEDLQNQIKKLTTKKPWWKFWGR